MKKEIRVIRSLIISAIVSAIFFAVAYLLGSFYNVSFDLNEWTEESRKTAVIWGGVFMSCGSFITFAWYILSKDEDNS